MSDFTVVVNKKMGVQRSSAGAYTAQAQLKLY